MSAPQTTPTVSSESTPRLHQPWRAAVAAGEVVLAVLLIFFVMLAWRRGIVPIEFPPAAENQGPQRVEQYHGNWLTLAVVLGTVAAVALLDALRQILLAVRTGGRRRARS